MKAWKQALASGLRATLPERARAALLHLAFHVAPEEFRRFAHAYAHAPDMELGLASLAGRGFAPATVIDVGAFQGEWSRLARRLWPSARLVMVEPNSRKHGALGALARELGAELLPALVGAEDGKRVPFHVMESGSSVLAERSPVPRTTETLVVRRLDGLLEGIGASSLLKVDAQGYELEVLRGAERLFPQLGAVLLEVALIEINEGAPLLHDVVAYLKDSGFVAYDLLEIHRRPLDGALNQVDILFVPERSPLVADKRHYA